jgi:hypothetical protein
MRVYRHRPAASLGVLVFSRDQQNYYEFTQEESFEQQAEKINKRLMIAIGIFIALTAAASVLAALVFKPSHADEGLNKIFWALTGVFAAAAAISGSLLAFRCWSLRRTEAPAVGHHLTRSEAAGLFVGGAFPTYDSASLNC